MTTITKLKAALEALEGGDLLCELKAAGLLQAVIAEMEAGEPVAWRWKNSLGEVVSDWQPLNSNYKSYAEQQVQEYSGSIEYAYTHPHPKAELADIDALCARIQAADDAAADGDYMLDSNDCISVIRGTWKGPLMNDMPQPKAEPLASVDAVEWAVGKWIAEVQNRPLVNVHRRPLDDTWRTVIRHFGGDDSKLLPLKKHDDLVMGAAQVAQPKAEPVQEPVAWQYKGSATIALAYKPGYVPAGEGWEPLYAQPKAEPAAAHQAKPLNEISISAAWAKVMSRTDGPLPLLDFARAIERAHGIGGEQ